jgi:hypothetical protein
LESDLIPKAGTLERVMLDKLMESENGVSFLDFVGTGITEDNIDQIAENLRHGMYESEDDDLLKEDA